MKNEELDIIIEKSLSTKPDFHLPANFAEKVTFTLVRRQQWKNDLYEYLYLTGLVVFLSSIVFGLYYYIDKEIIMQVFQFVSENVVQVAFAVFTLNFILFADRVLLRLLFSRWRMNE